MGSDDARKSIFKLLGLPDRFGEVLLILALIFTIAPYISGVDFGVFKVPSFDGPTTQLLKYLGPAPLAIAILLFIPIWSQKKNDAPKRLAAEYLLEMRGRFKLAQSRTEERDRVEFPMVWHSLVFEGGFHANPIEEDSYKVITRIQAFFAEQKDKNALKKMAELQELLSTLDRVDKHRDGPIDNRRWGTVKEQLAHGEKLVDGVLSDAGLKKYLVI